ncbi:MAG: glycosyl hydrolase [Rhizomicrobium sp.]|nr:glycosyl hydrolase [Rhizomicrobium sp.]
MRIMLAALMASAAFVLPAEAGPDALATGFATPPQSARPHTFWPWMNGNVTKDGIAKDLAWMQRVGLAGMPAVDAAIDTPTVVDHRIPYMSEEWKDTYRYAVDLAAQKNMEIGIEGAPGWSMSGGPWVTPQEGMKKLVWSSAKAEGGKRFKAILPQPPDNIGPLQNLPMAGDEAPTAKTASLHFYRDVVVMAYRTPAETPAIAHTFWNNGSLDSAQLNGGDLSKVITLTPTMPDGDVFLAVKYKKPATIEGVTLAMTVAKSLGYKAVVEASDDGEAWRAIADFPPAAQLQRMQMGEQTISFAPATARWFRVVLKPGEPLRRSYRPTGDAAPGAVPAGSVTQTSANPLLVKPGTVERAYQIRELQFHASATVHEFEKKAMFAAPPRDFYSLAGTPDIAPGSAIDPAGIVILNDKLKPDGTLEWTPPPGHWTVLRLGYSLVGAENHPAPPEATGLEVDKLNAAHVRAYFERYLDIYQKMLGPDLFGKRGVQMLEIGSSEIGQQNWTEDLITEFKLRRGYDPTPYLPALTGAVVNSPAASDKFLWDFRRTVEQLLADNHYGELAKVAHERGLFVQGEALEIFRPTFGDDMEMRQHFDVPMGAMWTYNTDKFPQQLTYEADLQGAASVAHIYGQKYIASESLTSDLQPWAWAPSGLKRYIDMVFARGANRVYIHTSVHQPLDKAPGLTLFGYGQMFDRHESWGEMAKPWLDYIARASYLLQQGRFVGDIAYFYGQEAPLTTLFGEKRVDLPPGYALDYFNADALLNQLSFENGELTTKSGQLYKVIYLGGASQRLTVSVLKKLRALVEAGAIIVGKRPLESPSLADTPEAFAAAAEAIFGKGGETAPRAVGKGRVFPAGLLPDALAVAIAPDFSTTGTTAMVQYVHRQLSDGEVYFVSSRSEKPESFTASFRTSGKLPELWDAVTGMSSPVSYRIHDGRTDVALALPANGSVFVVLRKPAKAQEVVLPAKIQTPVMTLSGAWSIAFQPGRGAPSAITSDLKPWNESVDQGVRYFSGEGTYRKTFVMPGKRKGAHYALDLGSVKEIAQVTLNGKAVGTSWMAPFKLDITKAVKPGKNVLTVKVANLWVNRLIGDAQPDTKEKIAFTTIATYRPDAPLCASGLLGPVQVLRVSGK